LFPKSERIVKTKEIQRAIKAPFRGSCAFGQILLSDRFTSFSEKKFPKRIPKLSHQKSSQIIKVQNLTEKKILEKSNYSKNQTEIQDQTKDQKNDNDVNQEINREIKKNNLKLEPKLEEKPNLANIVFEKKLSNDLNSKENQKYLPKNLDKIDQKKFEGFRVLCVVSKKIHKKANQRNKIRRRILAIFADLKNKKRLPPSLDCVIIIRSKDILTAKFEDCQKSFVPEIANLYQKMIRKNKFQKL